MVPTPTWLSAAVRGALGGSHGVVEGAVTGPRRRLSASLSTAGRAESPLGLDE